MTSFIRGLMQSSAWWWLWCCPTWCSSHVQSFCYIEIWCLWSDEVVNVFYYSTHFVFTLSGWMSIYRKLKPEAQTPSASPHISWIHCEDALMIFPKDFCPTFRFTSIADIAYTLSRFIELCSQRVERQSVSVWATWINEFAISFQSTEFHKKKEGGSFR